MWISLFITEYTQSVNTCIIFCGKALKTLIKITLVMKSKWSQLGLGDFQFFKRKITLQTGVWSFKDMGIYQTRMYNERCYQVTCWVSVVYRVLVMISQPLLHWFSSSSSFFLNVLQKAYQTWTSCFSPYAQTWPILWRSAIQKHTQITK